MRFAIKTICNHKTCVTRVEFRWMNINKISYSWTLKKVSFDLEYLSHLSRFVSLLFLSLNIWTESKYKFGLLQKKIQTFTPSRYLKKKLKHVSKINFLKLKNTNFFFLKNTNAKEEHTSITRKQTRNLWDVLNFKYRSP